MHRSSRRLSHDEVNSKLNVPFSWEFSPGIPKVTSQLGSASGVDWNAHFPTSFAKLPPPPCPSDHNMSARFDYVEENSIEKELNSLPLCSVLQMSHMVGSFSRLGGDPEPEDPFLAAFVNCTRSPHSAIANKLPKDKGKKYRVCAIIKKTIFTLSCIYSCNVMKENTMGTPQLSPKKSSCL
ncbi:hypothetical protein L484_003759 [Morus notabilis]|uniref:Uncharacterized protein n=1 Tax=Morus notabilis TaxID=981085 RepID=W9SEW0_9ROSA|nr:hypothetical protein L484_003759 [Morus notabilis]